MADESKRDIERRLIQDDTTVVRCECEKTGKPKYTIRGYAARYYRESSPVESKDLGGFTERIMPGAFDEAIKRGTDIVGLYNHDPMFILGRESSGTLRVYLDEEGLRYEIDAPESRQDVVEAISRGDVRGSSFAFRVSGAGEQWSRSPDGRQIRSIVSVDGLFDVGPVLKPAYPSSDSFVSQRALEIARGEIAPSDNPSMPEPEEGDESDEPAVETREVSLKPTAGMAAAAKRGLRLHEEGKSGDGLKPETVARANRLARREEMNRDWVVEMNAWFKRHASDKKAGWDEPGSETPGFVAHLLWGGDAAKNWSARKVDELERDGDRSSEETTEDREAPEEPQPETAATEPACEARAEPEPEKDDENMAGTLSANNYDAYEAMSRIAEENGRWPQQGPDGCQYTAKSQWASRGLKCANCIFYNEGGDCDIVDGEVDDEGLCRFWQIPEEKIAAEKNTRAASDAAKLKAASLMGASGARK